MAVEIATGLEVAIKTFNKQGMHAGHVFRMAQEMINLTCLQGIHVATVVCAFEDALRFYLVTEWCAGGDLRQHLANARLDEHTIVTKVLHPLLCVLSRMHATGVMHRDIKPENLLLSPDGSIQLADFGLSINYLDHLPFACVGTSGYMAPEVLANEHARLNESADITAEMLAAHKAQRYTPAVDVWSVGVLAKELMLMASSSAGSAGQGGVPLVTSPLLWWDFVHRACDVNPMRRASVKQLLNHPWLQQHLSPAPRGVAPKLVGHEPSFAWPLALLDGGTQEHQPRAACPRAGQAAAATPPSRQARCEAGGRAAGTAPPLPRGPLPHSDSCASFVSLDLGIMTTPAPRAAAPCAATAPPSPLPAGGTSSVSSTCIDSVELYPSPGGHGGWSPPPPVHRHLSSSFTSISLASPLAAWRAGAAADCRSCYSDMLAPSRQCRKAWRQYEAGGQDNGSDSGSEAGDATSHLAVHPARSSPGQVAKALRKARKAWGRVWSGVRSFM